MLSSLSILAQTLWVCVVLSWCVVDKLYFWYCVESVIVFHEGTDALADITYLDADIPCSTGSRSEELDPVEQ